MRPKLGPYRSCSALVCTSRRSRRFTRFFALCSPLSVFPGAVSRTRTSPMNATLWTLCAQPRACHGELRNFRPERSLTQEDRHELCQESGSPRCCPRRRRCRHRWCDGLVCGCSCQWRPGEHTGGKLRCVRSVTACGLSRRHRCIPAGACGATCAVLSGHCSRGDGSVAEPVGRPPRQSEPAVRNQRASGNVATRPCCRPPGSDQSSGGPTGAAVDRMRSRSP